MLWLASAGQAVTRDSIIVKCKGAAKLIQDVGLQKALKTIEDVNGQFVWNAKVNYVFVMDINGKTVGHPFRPEDKKLPNMLGLVDKNGKPFVEEFIKVAKSKHGMGWVNYMWPLPGQTKPTIKSTFIYRVPDTDYYVGSGLYVVRPGEYY